MFCALTICGMDFEHMPLCWAGQWATPCPDHESELIAWVDRLPSSDLAYSGPSEVTRVEDRTFICSEREKDRGPTNNSREPSEILPARPRPVRPASAVNSGALRARIGPIT